MCQNLDRLQGLVLETESAFLARKSDQETADKARLAASYPCLIETRLPGHPETLDALRGSLAAFLGSMGVPFDVDAGDILAYVRNQTVRIDLTDVNAVACRRLPEQQESVENGYRSGYRDI